MTDIATAEMLTARQRSILAFVRAAITEHGYPPSIREISEAVGLASNSSVSYQLRVLERKGYLRRNPTRPRTITITDTADHAGAINPDTVADEFGIQELTAKNGISTLTTIPTSEQARELVLAMSLACGRMLDDDQAPNYVEFEVSPADRPGYVVHVRRAGGPTPHTLRQEAEGRVAELEPRFDRYRTALESMAMHSCISRTHKRCWDRHSDQLDWCYPCMAQFALDPWIDREATA